MVAGPSNLNTDLGGYPNAYPTPNMAALQDLVYHAHAEGDT